MMLILSSHAHGDHRDHKSRVLLSGPIMAAMQPLRLTIGLHEEAIQFYITSGLHFPVVLGLAWLRMHDSQIYWSQNLITFRSLQCMDHTHQVCAGQLLNSPGVGLGSQLAFDCRPGWKQEMEDLYDNNELEEAPDWPNQLLMEAMNLMRKAIYSMWIQGTLTCAMGKVGVQKNATYE
ncbi:hypothetical protein E2320_004517 [Naja naja]|nr:hypothetical protein E2320_004517 [Naja naja]